MSCLSYAFLLMSCNSLLSKVEQCFSTVHSSPSVPPLLLPPAALLWGRWDRDLTTAWTSSSRGHPTCFVCRFFYKPFLNSPHTSTFSPNSTSRSYFVIKQMTNCLFCLFWLFTLSTNTSNSMALKVILCFWSLCSAGQKTVLLQYHCL